MKFNLLVLVTVITGSLLVAESGTERRLESIVRFLSDDLLEGRGTPGRGLDIAALYLEKELEALGWLPGNGDSYRQSFEVGYFDPKDASPEVYLNGAQLADDEYYLLPFSLDPGQSPLVYDVVFAGFGLSAPDRGVDNFGNVDVSGKAVVSIFGAPWEPSPTAPHAYDRLIGKSVHATVRNAGLFVYVSEEMEGEGNPKSPDYAFASEMVDAPYAYLKDGGGVPTMGMGGVLVLTPKGFDRTLANESGKTYSQWRSALMTESFKAEPLDARLELRMNVKASTGVSSNVIAVLPGSDPKLKDEWVILTAHYDHLGFKEVPPGQDGVWNGADDNASGTAVLVEVARRLGAGEKPARSVMIFFTAGEDRGILGAGYYAMHPIVPFENVTVNLNVDMVGRAAGAVTGYTTGCDELLAKAMEFGEVNGIEVRPNPDPAFRAVYFIDSYHFARFGVPYIEFFTEIHGDYHQPSDEADKLNFEGLSRIAEVVVDLAEFYAQGGKKPGFDPPDWFLAPK